MASSPPRSRVLRRNGATLTEVVLVLGLIGLLLSMAMPAFAALRDRAAAGSARESALALVHLARAAAVARGGADLVVDRVSHRLEALGPRGEVLATLDLSERRVRVETTGSRDRVTLRWNALGWGVVASRTLRFRRGSAEAFLVVSSRGRATRR